MKHVDSLVFDSFCEGFVDFCLYFRRKWISRKLIFVPLLPIKEFILIQTD